MMAEHDAVTETTPDTDLQLKKRARRRLVGATALALLAVIVLPMVMDHEPRPPVQDIQIRIPNQDAGGIAARLLPGKTVVTPLPAAMIKPSPAVTVKTESKAEPAPVVSAPTTTVPKAVPPVSSAVPPGVPATARPPASAEKKIAADTTKSAPSSASDPKPVKEPSAQWVVQLGAYKDAGNAKHLLAKLKEIHVPAYTEKLDTPQGPRVRVRAGPFASREAAEKIHAKLKIIGVDGPVVSK